MNVFGCNKKLANIEAPKRPLVDKIADLKETIKLNEDKVVSNSGILINSYMAS